MKIDLTSEEKQALEVQHKTECDGHIKDQIKVILLHSERWSAVQIAQALRIRVEAVHYYLEKYKQSKKLKPDNNDPSNDNITDLNITTQPLKPQRTQKNDTVNEEFLSNFAKFWRDYSRDS